jgi:hypothetical protein
MFCAQADNVSVSIAQINHAFVLTINVIIPSVGFARLDAASLPFLVVSECPPGSTEEQKLCAYYAAERVLTQ